MDDQQRVALQTEIEHHRTRIAELLAAIQELEENLRNVMDAPDDQLAHKAEMLRMELKGRRAAFTIGSAHLGANSPA
jgi:hypothetical protein